MGLVRTSNSERSLFPLFFLLILINIYIQYSLIFIEILIPNISYQRAPRMRVGIMEFANREA